MNFLAHHAVALQRVGSEQPPEFYVGNVLPDLVAVSGEGRLRITDPLPSDPLLQGIALHITTDKLFHSAPAFSKAQAIAKELLLAIPFAVPPRRVFFLVHAAVEVALDGCLLQNSTALADDFYARFAAADLTAVLDQTAALLRLDNPPLALARAIDGFVRSRYLYHYADTDGLAEALVRLCHRIGISDFAAGAADRALLNRYFSDLQLAITPTINRLLLREIPFGAVVE